MERIGAPAGSSPETLLARYRADGRPGDLAGLFDATAPELFRLALHLCPDAATAEDVLQETYLVVLERSSAWDPGRPAMPWLTGILKNQSLMARRRAARRPDPRRLEEPAPSDDPALEAVDAEEKERLREAMQRLPEPYRGVALLRWRYGLEPTEIADVKGVPPGTVWTWLHRAVQKMKVEMGALPALLLAFRPERGLDSVRSALLRRAAAKALVAEAAAGATASTAALTLGGLLMANKALAAAAAVLVLAGAGWLAFRPSTEPMPAAPPAVATVAPPAPAPAPKPVPPPGPAEGAKEESLPAPVDLSKCDRDLDLFGTVVDPKGTPIPGASLTALRRPWRRLAPFFHPEWAVVEEGPSTRSAKDGTFRLRLARREVVDLRARAVGLPEVLIQRCTAGEMVRVVLREGARIEVRALDEGGNPVPGVHLRFETFGEGPAPSVRADAETGPDGGFVFAGLPPGRGGLRAWHAALGSPRREIVEVPETGSARVDLKVPKGRALAGRVSDGATGKGIPGARVGEGPLLERPVKTDADGRFAYPGWTGNDESTLSVEVEGYGAQAQEVGDRATVDFVLGPAVAISGRVLSAKGEPVAGAPVLLFTGIRFGFGGGGPAMQIAWHICQAGPDGRFSVRDVNPDFPHVLIVAAAGHGRLLREIPPVSSAPDARDLGDLRLPEPRLIAGVVLDGEGKPVPGQDVELNTTLSEGTMIQFRQYPERCRTDDLGRFAFPDLSAGEYSLEARVDNAPPLALTVTLAADEDRTGLRLEPPKAEGPGGGVLRVKVLDPSGAPVAGMPLFCGGAQGKTDAEGIAVFRGLTAPKVSVQVNVFTLKGEVPRFLQQPPREVEVAAGEVVWTLEAASFLRGRVMDSAGNALPRMMVNAKYADGTWAGGATTQENGGFSLPVRGGVPVTVEVPGWQMAKDPGGNFARALVQPASLEVTAPSEKVEISLASIEGGRTLKVRVVDLEGRPIPKMPVLIPNPKNRTYPVTDEDGRLTVEDLLAEEITLSVSLPTLIVGGPPPIPAGTVLPAPVKVVPNGQEITLQLRKGVAVTGIVYGSDGRPVEKARVDIQTADLNLASDLTGPDGRFKVWIAPDSKLRWASAYTIAARENREQIQVQEADLAKMGNELVFRLEPIKARR
jgi:RNA polymerase sigma-70 factor (ECF subfamily)